MNNMPTVRAHPDGDSTRLDLRLVIAPSGGVFEPAPVATATCEGEIFTSGDLIGCIIGPGRTEDVTAFCGGFLVRWLAAPGERVRTGQPLAWLHPTDRSARPTPGSA